MSKNLLSTAVLSAWLATFCVAADAAKPETSPVVDTPTFQRIADLTDAQRSDLMQRGGRIYANQCASCHGDKGEGVEAAYESPLAGDRSIPQLASVIEATMPEGEPDLCVADDALATAYYAFETFYSEAAQLRSAPPRVSVARLTSEQFRQRLSDIYTRFRNRNRPAAERGLSAIYFNHSGWKDDKKAFERVDPSIHYDYGMNSPGDGIESKKFAVYWSGGLLIPETGRYEIIVRGMGAFKMFFINSEKPFFDNSVQSGDASEFRSSVELMGGRDYLISLEFYKRERKTGDVPASISLSWRRPGHVEEIIPTRYLIPGWHDHSFAPQIQLPADDRSAGYERGSTISRQWDEATTKASIEFATAIVDDIWPHYASEQKKRDGAPQGRDLLKAFAYELVDIALGHPAGEAVRKIYVDDQLTANLDDNEALRRIVLLTLKSPRFLYPSLPFEMSSSYRHATRLAMTMWDSVPDEHRWNQANDGNLKTESEIRDAAWSMLDDTRSKAKTREALHHWLNLDRIHDPTKNAELYPGFDPALVSDLRESFDLFLDDVVWSESSDFRQLLTADWSYSSDTMATFLGENWKPSGEAAQGRFSRTIADPQRRAGVLTHPFLMSGLAYSDSTSPIHRGVFLTRFMLGRVMQPPADAFSPLSPSLHADLTTRERVQLQTGSTACQACHSIINPLGFTLEQFDAVGRWRTEEVSKPIDAMGSYIDRSGGEIKFDGAIELSKYLLASDDAQTAFINRMFLHFVKQPIGAYGADRLETLKQKFREKNYSIKALIVEIAVIAAIGPRQPEAA